MYDYLKGLPGQLSDCLQWKYDAVKAEGEIRHLAVLGMGGSAIGGDILRSYALDRRLAIPVTVVRDYRVPGFVGRDSLVFAVSYSGNTEETLSACQQARRAGATVVAITSGGHLAQMAEQEGFPTIIVPSGLVPRAAIGYLTMPMLLVLARLGVLAGVEAEVEETIELLGRLREDLEPAPGAGSNMARQIAGELYQRIPVIWGVTGTSEIAALRWKTQINENAKSSAYVNVFPELNHNEIVGICEPSSLLAQTAIVMMKHPDDHPRVAKRISLTAEMVRSSVGSLIEVEASGRSWLSRLFSLIYLGDFVSVYLAEMYGIDPLPVQVIDELKRRMAQ